MQDRTSQQPLRAAIYARYSTDEQRPESIEDQFEACRRFCTSQGWTVTETYADAAMTGSSSHRPDYQRLLRDVERGLFDVIVIEALDRLSRRLSEIAAIHDQLDFRRVKLFAVDRGEITLMMVAMLGMMAEAYLEDLRHKTKRGLTGKILAGLSAGGLGYGYEIDSAVKGGRRIVAAEARIVRRILMLYANGVSPRAIAARLNSEGVPGPGGRPWSDTTIRGQVDRGTGILNNAAYIGRLMWNRCTYVRDPRTGKRVARPNPNDKWEEVAAPELRIVDDALWNRVKVRQQKVRTVMARDESGQALNRAHRAKHVLSGLIICGECGAPFAMRDARHYGCSNFRSQGMCDNRILIDRRQIENIVADAVRSRVVTVPAIEAIYDEMRAFHKDSLAESATASATLADRLAKTNGRIGHVVSAITETGHSKALVSKLQLLEAEAAGIAAEIEDIEAKTAPVAPFDKDRVERALAEVREQIDQSLIDFDDPAFANNDKAKEALRSLIDKIVVGRSDSGMLSIEVHSKFAGVMRSLDLWQDDDGEPFDDYEAETQKTPGEGSPGASVSVVAGAGFEPAAFRL